MKRSAALKIWAKSMDLDRWQSIFDLPVVRIFGIGKRLEAQTDIIMFLIEEHIVRDILDAIHTAGNFSKPGTGIAFVLPVEHVIGLESQLERIREEVHDQYF